MKVSKEQIEKAFQNFSLGEVSDYKSMELGVANQLFKVTTSSGDYILKIAIRNSEDDRVLHELELLNEITNLPTPKPIPTNNGAYLFEVGGYKAFVYPYLQGKPPKEITDNMLVEAGKTFAELHLQIVDFSTTVSEKRIRFWDIEAYYGLDLIAESVKKHPNQKIREAAEYALENIRTYSVDTTSLPVGCLHGDYKPENILFTDETITGILDFDNSYINPMIVDIAFSLVWFCRDGQVFNLEKAKLFLDAYLIKRSLTKSEKESLYSYIHYIYLGLFLVLAHLHFDKDYPMPEEFTLWCIDAFMPNHLELIQREKEFNEIFA